MANASVDPRTLVLKNKVLHTVILSPIGDFFAPQLGISLPANRHYQNDAVIGVQKQYEEHHDNIDMDNNSTTNNLMNNNHDEERWIQAMGGKTTQWA